MEIRATFDAMHDAMTLMQNTGQVQSDEQSRGTSQMMNAQGFWDDDAFTTARDVRHAMWVKNTTGSTDELSARVGATGQCVGLYQDCKQAVQATFAV